MGRDFRLQLDEAIGAQARVIGADANLFIVAERNGVLIAELALHNIVTKVGKAAIARRAGAVSAEPAFAWIGIGIGTTAETVDDTQLQTERSESGAANTNHKASTNTNIGTDNDTLQLVTTFNLSATLSIAEVGFFNATPGGVLGARKTFTALPLISGDNLTITWTLRVT